MNTKRLFQGIACAVLAFAVTAPVLARDDRGHDRGRSHHYDRRDDRRDWRDDRGMTGTTAATSARPIATAITRVKPTREAGSAWTTCYARQGKPEAAGLQRERENGEHGRTVRKLGAGRGQQRPKPTAPPIRRS